MRLKDSEIFDRATDVLAKRGGWRQGSLGHNDDSKCAIGALNYALFGDTRQLKRSSRRFKRLVVLLGQAAKIDFSGRQADYQYIAIENWNDKQNRRKSQVVAAFRKAATMARIKEMQTNIPEDIMAEETPPAASKPLDARAAAIAKMDGHKRDPQVKKLLEDAAKK